MPIITKIEYQVKDKNRVSIYLDEEFAFGLFIDLVFQFSLEKGKEISEEFIEEVLKQEEKRQAFRYSLNLVSKMLKTENELTTKLTRKGYSEEVISYVVDKLKEYNYIDDVNYANTFVQSKCSSSNYGKKMIKQKLIRKGIDREIIESALSDNLDEDVEFKNAMELAIKKQVSYIHLDKKIAYNKTAVYLQRKGYDYDIVKKVLEQLFKKGE